MSSSKQLRGEDRSFVETLTLLVQDRAVGAGRRLHLKRLVAEPRSDNPRILHEATVQLVVMPAQTEGPATEAAGTLGVVSFANLVTAQTEGPATEAAGALPMGTHVSFTFDPQEDLAEQLVSLDAMISGSVRAAADAASHQAEPPPLLAYPQLLAAAVIVLLVGSSVFMMLRILVPPPVLQ